MKEIKAWQTTDGKTFFDIKEAKTHEDGLIKHVACQKLADLFSSQEDICNLTEADELAYAIAVHVINNVRDFAVAISPLITQTKPQQPAIFKPPLSTYMNFSHEMGD